jgi:hypothetical protein
VAWFAGKPCGQDARPCLEPIRITGIAYNTFVQL